MYTYKIYSYIISMTTIDSSKNHYIILSTSNIGEKDGIHGSIKEIYYYNKVRSPSTIELLYNLSKNKT